MTSQPGKQTIAIHILLSQEENESYKEIWSVNRM